MKYEKIVLAVAALLFLWYLGAHDLWAPDEPFFGEGAREMLVDGQWLVSHVNGVVNSHKPPLFFWLIALFSIPLGAVTEFTARLPSVIAALVTLFLTMRLGCRWYGPKTSALAGVVLMTSFMFWDKARWSQTDSLLCGLIWIAIWAFAKFRAGELQGRKSGLIFWAAMGLAVLAKGPVGLLLPLLIAVITLACDRELRRWGQFAPFSGPALLVLICGLWVVSVSLWGPENYSVIGSLREHFIERGISGMHHVQPWWYYLERLPQSLLPWSGLLPGALFLAWYRRRESGDRLALVISVFVVLFFSISTEKRDLYVLPAFPAMALLIANLAGTLSGFRESANNSFVPNFKWFGIGHGIVSGILILVGLALPFAGRQVDEVAYAHVIVLALVLFPMGVISLISCIRKKPLHSVLTTAGGMGILFLYVVTFIYPAMEPSKSARDLSIKIRDITVDTRDSGNPLVAWRLGNTPTAVAFYSDGVYSLETEDAEVLTKHMQATGTVFALVNADEIDSMLKDKLAHTWILEEAYLSRRHIFLISNMKLPNGRPFQVN